MHAVHRQPTPWLKGRSETPSRAKLAGKSLEIVAPLWSRLCVLLPFEVYAWQHASATTPVRRRAPKLQFKRSQHRTTLKSNFVQRHHPGSKAAMTQLRCSPSTQQGQTSQNDAGPIQISDRRLRCRRRRHLKYTQLVRWSKGQTLWNKANAADKSKSSLLPSLTPNMRTVRTMTLTLSPGRITQEYLPVALATSSGAS